MIFVVRRSRIFGWFKKKELVFGKRVFARASARQLWLAGFAELAFLEVLQDFLGAINDLHGQAGKTPNLNAVAFICRPSLNAPEKYYGVAFFPDQDGVVLDPVQGARKFGKLMVMSGKKGLGLEIVMQVLGNSPCNAMPSKVLVPRPISSSTMRLLMLRYAGCWRSPAFPQ